MTATLDQFRWLAGGDHGISSETIWRVMTGDRPDSGRYWRPDRPADGADFGRCVRLLDRFPYWRARLPEMVTAYPEWAELVAAWDDLEALYRAEAHGSLYSRIRACLKARCLCGKYRAGFFDSDPDFKHGENACGFAKGASLPQGEPK